MNRRNIIKSLCSAPLMAMPSFGKQSIEENPLIYKTYRKNRKNIFCFSFLKNQKTLDRIIRDEAEDERITFSLLGLNPLHLELHGPYSLRRGGEKMRDNLISMNKTILVDLDKFSIKETSISLKNYINSGLILFSFN